MKQIIVRRLWEELEAETEVSARLSSRYLAI